MEKYIEIHSLDEARPDEIINAHHERISENFSFTMDEAEKAQEALSEVADGKCRLLVWRDVSDEEAIKTLEEVLQTETDPGARALHEAQLDLLRKRSGKADVLPENEDKQRICDLLLPALQATRSMYDLKDLRFDPEKEIVTAVFDNDWTKVVNVAADSGVAMIKDIVTHIV